VQSQIYKFAVKILYLSGYLIIDAAN